MRMLIILISARKATGNIAAPRRIPVGPAQPHKAKSLVTEGVQQGRRTCAGFM